MPYFDKSILQEVLLCHITLGDSHIITVCYFGSFNQEPEGNTKAAIIFIISSLISLNSEPLGNGDKPILTLLDP